MKPFLLLSLAIVILLHCNAAAQIFPDENSTLLDTQSGANKATALASRRIGYSFYNSTSAGALLPVDSTSTSYPALTPGLYAEAKDYTHVAGSWVQGDIWTYFRNAQNHLVLKKHLRLNAAASGYDTLEKTVYVNNTAGFITDETRQIWDSANSIYRNTLHYISAYDSNNRLEDVVLQQWNATSNVWENWQHDTYTRNSWGTVSSQLHQVWLAASSAWLNNSRTDNLFNGMGAQPLVQEKFVWQTAVSAWQSRFQEHFSLNSKGFSILNQSSVFDTVKNIWLPWARKELFYDTADNPIVIIDAQYDSAANTHLLVSRQDLKYNGLKQVTSIYTTRYTANSYPSLANYYYQFYQTGITGSTTDKPQIELFPNPVNNELQLRMTQGPGRNITGQLTDLHGRVYKQFVTLLPGSGTLSISTSDVPDGNYILRVQNEYGSASRLLIIVH